MGNAVSANVNIAADVGMTNAPTLRFDVADNKWKFSNDGTTFTEMGTGGGGGDLTDVLAGTGISVSSGSGPQPTVSLDVAVSPIWTGTHIFNGSALFNTTTDFVFSGTEHATITSDLAGSVDVLSVTATPSGTAGTTRGIYIQQADSANTNGLDLGILIHNADTDLAVTTAIGITSAGGGFTNYLDTPSLDITGTGAISGATGLASSGTITLSGLASCTSVKTDAGGVLSCGSGLVEGGDITAVTAGAGLTGGATSGSANLDVGAGSGISVSADAVALGTLTADWSQHYLRSSRRH